MTTQFKGVMVYDTDSHHKDAPNQKGLLYSDTYTIDKDVFGNSRDAIYSYIANDMRLVAGGGYDDDHIQNVSLQIFVA